MPDDTIFGNIPDEPKPTNDEIVSELNEINEKDYLKKIKAKNSRKLIKLDFLEKERIAQYIVDLYNEEKDRQKEIEDRIDEYDDVYRMERDASIDTTGDLPNYRTPLSTVTLEVIHANIMNVFFTPKDILRIIPTEQNDIPKIKKLDIFGNWSIKNELNIFENIDRLFHNSGKNNDCPYAVYWLKEYGTEIKKEMLMNPAKPTEPLIDPDTKEPMFQEREVSKTTYNAPKLEVFSRKDYIIPKNTVYGKVPPWEMRKIRIDADKVYRHELEGKYYDKTFDEIGGWGNLSFQYSIDNSQKDKEGSEAPLGKTEKLFIEFYGKLRINQIIKDENDEESYKELEDEFIATIEINSKTLCSLRKNKFPMKMRPFGLDIFMPDSEGRAEGIGVIEFMRGVQRCYDALFNQYLFGVTQSNSPFGFFTPTGNMKDEPIKVQTGHLYPSSDPQSINIVKIPPPDQSLIQMMEQVRNQAQSMFGVSDYAIGMESSIDPSAPARKAELVVGQGQVRLNLIIKRRNQTLKDIFKRWYLLYKENMPANKFIRIVGESGEDPFKFESIKMEDFALNSIPDFELTGNVLNVNKTLEANKALSIYDKLSQNFLFSPQTSQGLQAYYALTKWFMDKLDETGISRFLPDMKMTDVHTPEEENGMFMQGDISEPKPGEDHIYHIKTHAQMFLDPLVPQEVKQIIAQHNQKHVELLKKQVMQQYVASQQKPTMPNVGGMPNAGQPENAGAGGVLPARPNMGNIEGGNFEGI